MSARRNNSLQKAAILDEIDSTTTLVMAKLFVIRQNVERARLEGATWQEIGEALGVTTQAAWERYRPVEHPKPIRGI